jgi:hypothetical protein
MEETWLYHYDPETKRQLMEWRHSRSSRSKIFRVQKYAGKISPLFLGIKTASSHWLSSKGPEYQRRVLLVYAGVIEIHFEGKIPWEDHQAVLDLALLTGHLKLRRNWPTWDSSVLITQPIIRQATASSLDWKTNESSQFFFRRIGQSCRGVLVGLTKVRIFLICSQKL